ncbi:MAG: glycosyltransferase [Candidatus Paceibacterota bacterium]|jgi:dolichyl-phosphate beta-glucosyltransferase|nr:glycosyltransferase [Candidatus Paceibacterota bacterium]
MEQKELSIIIPAYQKGKWIDNTIKSLIGYFPQAEIVVINDGSTDNTRKIKDTFKDQIVYLENEENQGKGYSLRKGFAYAHGHYLVFTDADLPFSVKDVERVFQLLKKNKIITIGRRKEFYNDRFYKKLLRPILYFLLMIFFGFKYFDTQCGLKGFTKDQGKKIISSTVTNGFAIDIEILYLAKKLNYPVAEVLVEQEESSLSPSTFNLINMLRVVMDLFIIRFNKYELS